MDLWSKMNVPKIYFKSVVRKVKALMLKYKKIVKRPKENNNFETIFDITSKNDNMKVDSDSVSDIMSDSVSIFDEDQESIDTDYDTDCKHVTRQPYVSPLVPVVNLVTKVNVSTKKASKICKQLADSGINIPTPSQPAIYKAVIKQAEQKLQEYKSTLKNESWCLHFDGKKIAKKEIQVIVLKNETKEIKLAVLVVDDGKASTIFKGIKETLDQFDLWQSIKMIITDTTNVNTGEKNGVITQIQNYFKTIELPPPQYIGCQHHVLDLVLRHVMDEVLDGKTSSPNISYNFVDELISDYDYLKINYKQNEERIESKNIKWRDDMQYLYELGKAYRYYKKITYFHTYILNLYPQ